MKAKRDEHTRLLLAKREEDMNKLRAALEAIKNDIADLEEKCADESINDSLRKDIEEQIAKRKAEKANVEMELRQTEMEVGELTATAGRGKHFDKYLVFQNIRELLKKSEVKLGQIEKEAGCQTGYMSRLEKPESTTDPTTEFIVTAAKMLGVSVDTMLFVPIRELTPTELYIISLLEKLIRDTNADKLSWERESALSLSETGLDEFGFVEHELFTDKVTLETFDNDYPEPEHHVYFPSRAFEESTGFCGDGFSLRMKNGTHMYLMNLYDRVGDPKDTGSYCKEIWMIQYRENATYLCGTKDRSRISALVGALYSTVDENTRHLKVTKDYQYILDAFMNDDLEDDPPENDPDRLYP